MNQPHPNSPLALSQSSLWRHIKRLCPQFYKDFQDQLIEFLASGCILFCLILVAILFPISFPLLAYFRRRGYQKQVKQWNKK